MALYVSQNSTRRLHVERPERLDTAREKQTSGNRTFTIFTKIAGASETNISLSNASGANSSWAVACFAVSDTDANCLFDVSGSQLNASSTSMAAPAVTATDSGSVLLFGGGAWNGRNVFPFHKTTQRSIYEAARAGHPDCDDVLLHNERGELTEFTIGNLVVELDGHLVTPPVECGLLAGTFRAHLIESGTITERIVPVHRLRQCTKIYRIHSVRAWEPVISS